MDPGAAVTQELDADELRAAMLAELDRIIEASTKHLQFIERDQGGKFGKPRKSYQEYDRERQFAQGRASAAGEIRKLLEGS